MENFARLEMRGEGAVLEKFFHELEEGAELTLSLQQCYMQLVFPARKGYKGR